MILFFFSFLLFFPQNGRLSKTLQMTWFMSALGSYGRASRNLISTIQNSDLDDLEQCRIINDRIMGVNETCCNLKPIDSSTASQAIERASSRGPSLAFRSMETGSILENGPGGGDGKSVFSPNSWELFYFKLPCWVRNRLNKHSSKKYTYAVAS